ncbi:MAG: lysophospholipid acyltransferase family protein [Gammaproteobacteria bacterium]|nr:lysophospholipid acyltransferase family protein [Gammaproteobacteria bacterium]
MRTMTLKRRITYAIIKPLIKTFLYIIWWTCRVKTIAGDENAQQLIKKDEPIIPCYWHQMHIFGTWYMRLLQKRGLKIGFLISPSVDGEVIVNLVKSWGAIAIRGSSTRTGAKAMRDMYNTIVKDKISPVTTSDGPTGPLHEFKQGAVMLSQLTQAPMLPIAYAASRFWQLKSWDQFIIPKPFSNIVIAVGKPHYINKKNSAEELEAERLSMEKEVMDCIKIAKESL